MSVRFRTITDTCGKILYRNPPVGGKAVPYRTRIRICEYRTVTIRCTVSDTSTSTVVVSDLPNVTDLPKVTGQGVARAWTYRWTKKWTTNHNLPGLRLIDHFSAVGALCI